MYKVNEWNINRLFVNYIRLKYKEKTRYMSNQAVLMHYKFIYKNKHQEGSKYYRDFIKLMIKRCFCQMLKKIKKNIGKVCQKI